jgi:hypothetical protein
MGTKNKMAKYKIRHRKVYDDNTFGDWKRWSSRVYKELVHANQAKYQLELNNYNWGFDFEVSKIWKYEFAIELQENVSHR